MALANMVYIIKYCGQSTDKGISHLPLLDLDSPFWLL